MKNYHWIIIIILVLAGCAPNSGLETATIVPSPTLTVPTLTFTPQPTQTATATLTPRATLEPEQAKETIMTLLQDSVDCDAPCFWGIMPEKTTLNEAKGMFRHLGLQIESTTYEGKNFYGIEYDLDSGLSITVTLTVYANIVENLRVDINPETRKTGVPRGWSVYSPEILIGRYGTPSKVDLFFDGGAPHPTYFMDMYFNSEKLIIEYVSDDLGPNLLACPLTGQMSSVRVWMGENPVYPPLDAVLLEKATSMTMEEFSGLMTRDPGKACFNLNAEAFP